MKEPVQQKLLPFNFFSIIHNPDPSRTPNLHSYNTPHTVKMGKVPVPQGIRYAPYTIKSSRRRVGSPPPDGWGIWAGSRHAQLTGDMFAFLENLNTRYGGRNLREFVRR